MAFSGIVADDSIVIGSMLGEPCSVHDGGHVYSDDGAGGPLYVEFDEAVPSGANAYGNMTEVTLAHMAAKSLTDQGMVKPCEGMLIVCNAKDDPRGGEFLGDRFGGCTYHVDHVETKKAETWTFRVTKQQV